MSSASTSCRSTSLGQPLPVPRYIVQLILFGVEIEATSPSICLHACSTDSRHMQISRHLQFSLDVCIRDSNEHLSLPSLQSGAIHKEMCCLRCKARALYHVCYAYRYTIVDVHACPRQGCYVLREFPLQTPEKKLPDKSSDCVWSTLIHSPINLTLRLTEGSNVGRE